MTLLCPILLGRTGPPKTAQQDYSPHSSPRSTHDKRQRRELSGQAKSQKQPEEKLSRSGIAIKNLVAQVALFSTAKTDFLAARLAFFSTAISIWFSSFAKKTARASGRPGAFGLAVLVILVWAVTGPNVLVCNLNS